MGAGKRLQGRGHAVTSDPKTHCDALATGCGPNAIEIFSWLTEKYRPLTATAAAEKKHPRINNDRSPVAKRSAGSIPLATRDGHRGPCAEEVRGRIDSLHSTRSTTDILQAFDDKTAAAAGGILALTVVSSPLLDPWLVPRLISGVTQPA
jgi:hypothetical protein